MSEQLVRWRLGGIAGAMLLAAVIAALPQAALADAGVTIQNFAFSPATVTVGVGETVTWTNAESGVPHTVTADTAGVMDSGAMNPGATFSKTFASAGTFTYHCEIHPGMTGTVVVTGGAATATQAAPTSTPTLPPTPTTGAASPTPTPASGSGATSPTAPASGTPTNTPTASPGGTTVTATPTAAGTSAAASPSAGSTPVAPSTGDDGGGDGGNGLLWGLAGAALVVAAGGGAYAFLRRRSG